jgi:hypothetical protein
MATTDPKAAADGNANDLPDLYRLLALSPLESDARKIEQALEAVRKRAASAKESDPKLAQRAQRIFLLGQKNLQDAGRKSAYDRAWRKAFGGSASATAVAGAAGRSDDTRAASQTWVATEEPAELEMTWDMSELEAYLPAEDPRAAFDLADFLRHSESSPEFNLDADYDRLQGFLGGAPIATATLVPAESVSALALMPELAGGDGVGGDGAVRSKSIHRQDGLPQSRDLVRARPATSTHKHKGGVSLALQMRKKRSRGFMLSIAGMLVGVGAILGVTLYLIRDNSPSLGNTQPTALVQNVAPKSPDPKASLPAVPKGSGLPKVSGLDDVSGAPADSSTPRAELDGDSAMPAEVSAPAMTNEPLATSPESMAAETMVPETPMPGKTGPEAMDSETTTKPPVVPSTADPLLNAEEKSQWKKSMEEIRSSLGLQEFDKAQLQLEQAKKNARTSVQREQHQRLSTVAGLAREFHGALVSAVTGMGGGESFTIGKSSSASFIEGSATEISIRFSGQNRTYKLTELPVGLAYGLADLRLGSENSSTLARKAAFALVHTKSNPLALKEAREMISRAAAAGVVESDLPEVFDDDYSLPEQ